MKSLTVLIKIKPKYEHFVDNKVSIILMLTLKLEKHQNIVIFTFNVSYNMKKASYVYQKYCLSQEISNFVMINATFFLIRNTSNF